MRRTLVVVGLAACVSACGGGSDSGGSPSGPSSTTTSVAVTLRDVVLVGATAQAAATATMSGGQTQPVTTGFRSDAAAVATVTDGGLVTGVANGGATITASSGGRDGIKPIRVAPNYDGRWQGVQIVTACGATGDLAGACEEEGGNIGNPFPISLTARHPGDLAVSGEFGIEGFQFPTFTTSVENDGVIRFSGTADVAEGIRAEVSWQINSTQNGRATGTIREKYTAPGILTGELTYDSTLSNFVKGGVALQATPAGAHLKNVQRLIRRLK